MLDLEGWSIGHVPGYAAKHICTLFVGVHIDVCMCVNICGYHMTHEFLKEHSYTLYNMFFFHTCNILEKTYFTFPAANLKTKYTH